MQNKTDKGTLLVSKSLPVKILNFINCLFSERNRNCYAYLYENEETSTSEAVTNGINIDKIIKVEF